MRICQYARKSEINTTNIEVEDLARNHEGQELLRRRRQRIADCLPDLVGDVGDAVDANALLLHELLGRGSCHWRLRDGGYWIEELNFEYERRLSGLSG